MTNDYFERLGLPRRFSLDAAELERGYLARSRAVHPDYHVTGADAELAASLEASAALNEAYNALRDAFTRAEYLLTLEGGPTASEHKQLPPAFLAEMMEAREEVEQARGKRGEIERLDATFTKRYDKIMAEVAAAFETLHAATDRDKVSRAIRTNLNAAKYVRGLLRDLHAD